MRKKSEARTLTGACGSYMDCKPGQKYDFERIYETIRKCNPMLAFLTVDRIFFG